jgi:hypothetical protein
LSSPRGYAFALGSEDSVISTEARVLKRLVPRLRGPLELVIEDNAGLIRFAKMVGIVLLVGGAYWLFRILE